MRHRNSGRKFKRSPSHRRMLLRNLATALIEHGRIETTLAKAKEIQPYTEKLISLACRGIKRQRAVDATKLPNPYVLSVGPDMRVNQKLIRDVLLLCQYKAA